MEILKEDSFRRQLKKGLNGAYLFFGEEDYLKSFSLKSARSLICDDPTLAVFNDVRIDPLDYTPDTLVNALMSFPMMGEKKIVTIDGLSLASAKASEIAELTEAIGAIEEYDYNVLIISIPAGLIDEGILPKRPSTALSTIAKKATLVHFESISGARLNAWVQKHLEHNGVTASPQVCANLIERCGGSMYALSNETEKLAYYLLQHGRSEVTLDDVSLISCTIMHSDAYALANAILENRYADAISALNVMKFKRIEPTIALSEVSRAICDLFLIKILSADGVPATEIMRMLKITSEYKFKLYASAAQKSSREAFERAIRLCSEADLALKRGSNGYMIIERLICVL